MTVKDRLEKINEDCYKALIEVCEQTNAGISDFNVGWDKTVVSYFLKDDFGNPTGDKVKLELSNTKYFKNEGE